MPDRQADAEDVHDDTAVHCVYSDRVVLPGGERAVGARIDVTGRTIAAVVVQDRAAFQASGHAGHALDLGDRLITPALVNAHTHLSMVALRGLGGDEARRGNVVEDLWFRLEGLQTPDDIRAFARIGALECVLSGQGAAFDHYYHARSVGLAMADVGLEGVVAETLQDLGGPAAGSWSEGLTRTQALTEDSELAGQGIRVAVGPHATDTVSDLLWARITALARRLGLPLHLHLAQSAQEVGRARTEGFRSPVHRLLARGRLDGLARVWLAHGLFVTDADRRALSADRDVLVHCPLAQAQFAFPADVPAWRAAGIPIALGTDAGACNDGMDVQREVILLAHGSAWSTTYASHLRALLEGDLDRGVAATEADRVERLDQRAPWAEPRRALDAVWDVPATLHPELPVGRIQVGARASLCAWDLDHPAMWPASDPLRALAFGAPGRALHTVIVGGRVIGQVGDPSALLRQEQTQAWVAEAHARRRELFRRAGLGHA